VRTGRGTREQKKMVAKVREISDTAMKRFLDDLLKIPPKHWESVPYEGYLAKAAQEEGYRSVNHLANEAIRILGGDRFAELIKQINEDRKKRVNDLIEELESGKRRR
jgi:hypothetical protein